jgi:Tfp pilus assembly protein PilF
MKTKTLIMSAASCVSLLAGCAQQTARNDLWPIKPVMVTQVRGENPQAWYDLGRYYQGQERHAQAATALEKAVAADGGFAEARNRLGVSYAMLGHYQDAVQQLEAAIAAAPQAAHIYSNLGYVHYLQGNDSAAATALQRAVALEPGNRNAQHNLGLVYARQGNEAKARVAFSAAEPQPETMVPPTMASPAMVPEQSPSQIVQVSPNVYELLPTPAAPMVAVQPETAPVHQARLQVSDDNGVNGIARRESPSQIVQVAPNVYELRPNPVAALATALPKPAPAHHARLEVSNGNGVNGMARRVGAFLKDSGFATSRLTNNQKGFGVRATRVEYRTGHEAEARQVAAAMPGRVEIMPGTNLRRDIGLRVVLGKDMTSSLGYFEQNAGTAKLARNSRR